MGFYVGKDLLTAIIIFYTINRPTVGLKLSNRHNKDF